VRPARLYMAASVVAACVITMVAAQSQAQTYKVLYSFCSAHNCTDGMAPNAGLIQDAEGSLYGTTSAGGAYGNGTIFKVSKTGKEAVLHSFCSRSGCPDGAYPSAGLIQDDQGNLYGTTGDGGAFGYGTVFKLSKMGKETVLHSFCHKSGCLDGAQPSGGLIRDTNGNLYGTTQTGGDSAYCPNGCGVVFKVDMKGRETVLYSFCLQSGCPDGSYPTAGLVRDVLGNLYGTTGLGGEPGCFKYYGCGVVFKLDPSGKETVLYAFAGGADGGNPSAGVIRDTNGNLYGTTYGYFFGNGTDFGTAFKLSKTGEETVLYNFCSQSSCADGASPEAVLVRGLNGNLYGTTLAGGETCVWGECGVAFKLDPRGKETVLYAFCSQPGCTDGALPEAGLIRDASGNLYGTTSAGGANNCGGYACGTVFKLSPN
jgi:uncharacterized repeat protein (TIGR03803 family)